MYTLAAQFDVPFQSASGRPNEKMLLNIINRYNGNPDFKMPKDGDVLEEITVDTGIPKTSPLSLIKEHGAINAKEFGDIAGGKLGRDVKGVTPGLEFRKGKKTCAFQGFGDEKMGIDETGRLLAEYGYITEQQAEDANYVRDYIRAWIDKNPKVSKQTTYIKYWDEDEIGKLEAGFQDLPEV